MAPRFSYRLNGDFSLSGERHTLDGLRRWWERSTKLLSNPIVQVEEIIVARGRGTPRIATRARVHAVLEDGSTYDNIFMQNLSMRWSRISEIHTLEDTAILKAALDKLAAAGSSEAHALPITN